MRDHNFQVTDIKKVTAEVMVNWLKEHGYKQDRYGHFQKTVTTPSISSTYRMKLSSVMVRKEVKSGDSWMRISSGYFKALTINEAGQLIGNESLVLVGIQIIEPA